MNKLEQAARHALEAIEHHGGKLPWNAFVEVRKDLREALEDESAQEPEDIKSARASAYQRGYLNGMRRLAS